MVRRVLTAILSAILFSIFMGFMNYMTLSNGGFEDFWVPTIFFVTYTLPVYIIGGIPIAFLIERVIKKINFSSDIARYYTRYGLYILAGIIVAVIYTFVLAIRENNSNIYSQQLFMYMVGGVIASLIYYYVSLLFRKKETE